MENSSFLTVISTTIRNAFNAITNAITTFRNTWNRVNDPAEIRRDEAMYQHTSMRRNLGIAFFLGCLFAFGTFDCSLIFAMELGEVLGLGQGFPYYAGSLVEIGIATAILAYATGLCGLYRTCLATGQMRRYHEVERRLPRAIRRILFSIIILVAVSVALQRVDGLDQQLPMVAEAADWVIDTFNTQMPKVVDYFKDLFARFIETLPH